MFLKATLDGGLGNLMRAETDAIARGVTQAVRETGERIKQDLRSQVLSGGLGQKLAKAWRSDVFPKNKPSLEAAGYVYSKAPKIHRAFMENTRIKSKDGWFLAIPTENCPNRIGGKRPTPSLYERIIGRLFLIYRRGQPSLLVAKNQRARTGKRGGFANANEKAIAKGQGLATVVMFILVPQVTLKKRIDFDGAEKSAERLLADAVIRNLNTDNR